MKLLLILLSALPILYVTQIPAFGWLRLWSAPGEAISPYTLLILLIGSGMILFALVGFGILYYYSQRSPQPAGRKSPARSSKPDEAEPSFHSTDQPRQSAAPPDGLELELEVNWKEILQKKTVWKGHLRSEPEGEVIFPAGGLVLRFRVGVPAQLPAVSRPNLGMAQLKADFEIDGIYPHRNLLQKAKNLRILERSAVLIRGELPLPLLGEGKYSFYLEVPDSRGNIQQIDLRFLCMLPQMRLLVEQNGKTAEARFKQGQTSFSQSEIPFFNPNGLRFSFWVRGLPEPVGRDAWLDSRHSPELTVSFPLQPHPTITIRAGSNLLKGGEVLRSMVLTRWQGNQIQGTFYVAGPIPDGLHRFQAVVKDDQGNEYSVRLDFVAAEGALQAVNQAGERLNMITAVKWEEYELNEDSIRRHLFSLQAVDPVFGQAPLPGQPPWTAIVESLDAEGKPIVPAFHLPMQTEIDSYRLRSTMPLLAYPLEKPAPVGGNILPIPIKAGGSLSASLSQGGIRSLELPIAQFRIERVWSSLEDRGNLEDLKLIIVTWFTMPEMELPSEVYLFLSTEDSNEKRWQAGAKPIGLSTAAAGSPHPSHRLVLAQFCFSAENCPWGAFSVFFDLPLKQTSFHLELALSLDPEFPLPPAEARLPLCSLGSLWMEVGDREFNPDEIHKPVIINPLVDGAVLPVNLSLRPAGITERAIGCIRLEVENKTLARHVAEFPSLNTVTGPDGVERFGRLEMEWKPELAPLCRGKGALVFCFNIQAKDPTSESVFWYRLRRAIPSNPNVDEIERSGVEFRWQNEQGVEEIRQIEGTAFLNPQHAVVLPYDAVVKVNATVWAKNIYGHLSPVREGVAVEWELAESDSGVQLLDGTRVVKTWLSRTDDKGVAFVRFKTPPADAKKGEMVINLRARTEGKEWISYPFRIRQRTILRVEGPRQVIANSQDTYEIFTLTGGEEATEWAFYPPNRDGSMPDQPAFTARGRSLRCAFDKIENQRGVVNPNRSYIYRIAARHAGDEEIIQVRALEIEVNPRIDNDIYDLGSTIRLKAQIYPSLTFQPSPWRWYLQREGDDQPYELAHEESGDQLESQMRPYIVDQPGKYRLRVEVGGGYRDQSFRVEPMRVFGPHLVQPGETARLILRNEYLQRAKWTVYRGVDRVDSDTGAKLEWRSNAIGYYEIAVEWSKDDDAKSYRNNAIHRILVARLYCDPAVNLETPIPPGGRRRYLINPVEFRGRKPRWRITYQRGEKLWTENLGEGDSMGLINNNEAEKGILEASFGSFEDMFDVTARTVVFFSLVDKEESLDRTIGAGV